MMECPVCGLLNQDTQKVDSSIWVSCMRCGDFKITEELRDDLPSDEMRYPYLRIKLSHFIRRNQRPRNGETPPYDQKDLETSIDEYVAPNPAEQADDLLLWVAEKTTESGSWVNFALEEVQSVIRSLSTDNVWYICTSIETEEAIKLNPSVLNGSIRTYQAQITFRGWRRVEEIRGLRKNSKTAFIAMKFGEVELDNLLENEIRRTVKDTGFIVRRLDDKPKAGLIDDRMRLEIKSARFVLVDLTHGNPGAYWEAGYAEGLGKPVIYLCKKEVFENPGTKPHFDTNHHLSVNWDLTDKEAFCRQLKATICNTIPEAIWSDKKN